MRTVTTIARYIIAIMFIVFGLNGFLHFIPQAPIPGLGGQFITILVASHYAILVFLIQVVCGILFLINRYVPLALTLIGPVIVNILLFHLTMNPGGIIPGLLVAICWFIVFNSVRSSFDGIFGNRRK